MYKTKSSRTSSADEIRETTAVSINVNLNFFPSLVVEVAVTVAAGAAVWVAVEVAVSVATGAAIGVAVEVAVCVAIDVAIGVAIEVAVTVVAGAAVEVAVCVAVGDTVKVTALCH